MNIYYSFLILAIHIRMNEWKKINWMGPIQCIFLYTVEYFLSGIGANFAQYSLLKQSGRMWFRWPSRALLLFSTLRNTPWLLRSPVLQLPPPPRQGQTQPGVTEPNVRHFLGGGRSSPCSPPLTRQLQWHATTASPGLMFQAKCSSQFGPISQIALRLVMPPALDDTYNKVGGEGRQGWRHFFCVHSQLCVHQTNFDQFWSQHVILVIEGGILAAATFETLPWWDASVQIPSCIPWL